MTTRCFVAHVRDEMTPQSGEIVRSGISWKSGCHGRGPIPGTDSLRIAQDLSKCTGRPVMQLFDRSDGSSCDLGDLWRRPTAQCPEDQHLGLIVGQQIEIGHQIFKDERADGITLHIDRRRDGSVLTSVETVLHPSHPPADLVDAPRSGDGEHPGAKPASVPLEVPDTTGDFEEHVTEDVLWVGEPARFEKPEHLWGQPSVEHFPGTLVPGSCTFQDVFEVPGSLQRAHWHRNGACAAQVVPGWWCGIDVLARAQLAHGPAPGTPDVAPSTIPRVVISVSRTVEYPP